MSINVPSSSFSILDIGGSGLRSHQKALEVTSHNLDNVNTPGYARQAATLSSLSPTNGVQVTGVSQVTSAYADLQVRKALSDVGFSDSSSRALRTTEAIVSPSSGGVSQAMSDFYAALGDMANSNPQDLSLRAIVLKKAQALTSQFATTSFALATQAAGMTKDVAQMVQQINTDASQVATLNQQIAQVEAGGVSANDLRDQREQLVKTISSLVNVSTTEDPSGQLTVTVGAGQSLVTAGTVTPLVASSLTAASVTGGSLKGLLDARDSAIPAYQLALDTAAQTFAASVNTQQAKGFGLTGTAGAPLFTGSTAATLDVSLTDPKGLAAATTAAGVPGDNTNARAMGALNTATFHTLGDLSVNDYLTQAVTTVGVAAQRAETQSTVAHATLTQMQTLREEVSGVSMDEELVKLQEYQRGYAASAKVVQAGNEMAQTAINLKP